MESEATESTMGLGDADLEVEGEVEGDGGGEWPKNCRYSKSSKSGGRRSMGPRSCTLYFCSLSMLSQRLFSKRNSELCRCIANIIAIYQPADGNGSGSDRARIGVVWIGEIK